MSMQAMQPGADDRAIHEVLQEIASSAPPRLPDQVVAAPPPMQHPPPHQHLPHQQLPPPQVGALQPPYGQLYAHQLAQTYGPPKPSLVDMDDLKKAALIGALFALASNRQLLAFMSTKIPNPMVLLFVLSAMFGVTAVALVKFAPV